MNGHGSSAFNTLLLVGSAAALPPLRAQQSLRATENLVSQ
jgi:hypothetical protein